MAFVALRDRGNRRRGSDWPAFVYVRVTDDYGAPVRNAQTGMQIDIDDTSKGPAVTAPVVVVRSGIAESRLADPADLDGRTTIATGGLDEEQIPIVTADGELGRMGRVHLTRAEAWRSSDAGRPLAVTIRPAVRAEVTLDMSGSPSCEWPSPSAFAGLAVPDRVVVQRTVAVRPGTTTVRLTLPAPPGTYDLVSGRLDTGPVRTEVVLPRDGRESIELPPLRLYEANSTGSTERTERRD